MYRKLPKKININKVFIVPAMVVLDNKDENNCYLSKPVMKIVCVNKKGNKYELVDLETKILCIDEEECEKKEAGLICVSMTKLLPLNGFVNEKYKNKALSQDKIIEIGKFILRNTHDINISTILNLISYNKLYVVKVYDSKNNIIKKKAITYRLGNQFIDVDSKEIYLLDEGIIDKRIEADLKIVKPGEILLMDEYIKMYEYGKEKKLRRRKYE